LAYHDNETLLKIKNSTEKEINDENWLEKNATWYAVFLGEITIKSQNEIFKDTRKFFYKKARTLLKARYVKWKIIKSPEDSVALIIRINKKIFVSWRGTFSLTGWINNVRISKTKWIYNDLGPARVHTGFMEAYDAIRKPLIDAVKYFSCKSSIKSICITGTPYLNIVKKKILINFKINSFP